MRATTSRQTSIVDVMRAVEALKNAACALPDLPAGESAALRATYAELRQHAAAVCSLAYQLANAAQSRVRDRK